MITSHPPNHNRLLDLDQTLLGWKQSAQTHSEDIWEEEDYEAIEQENMYIDEAIAIDAKIVDSSDSFSYQGIADRLERRKSLGYGSLHQRRRSAAVEEDVETEEMLFAPSFFGESPAVTAEPFDKEESSTFSTPSDWQQAFTPTATPFSLPEIELPDADLADSMFVADSMFDSSEDFSSEGLLNDRGTSYSALFQSIQAARQGDPTGLEDEALTIAATKPTIDIAAQTID